LVSARRAIIMSAALIKTASGLFGGSLGFDYALPVTKRSNRIT
jgi:hypothetical protein